MLSGMSSARTIARTLIARPTSDGAGVRLKRSIGGPELGELDPFLLLDEFRSEASADYIAGFPDHPHRGFETVTYMLHGRMEHRDHMGNHGELYPGSIQWMTAGRGIIHSEMPRQDHGLMWGFQLWVNLPARDKLCPPRYQDIPPDAVPIARPAPGAEVRVLCGEAFGERGPVTGVATQPSYLDVRLQAGVALNVPITAGHNAFCYAYEGSGQVGEPAEPLQAGQLGVLTDGASLSVRAEGAGLRCLVVAGRPLGEPVARYGPFVMNTPDEIRKAITDYQTGKLLGPG
jgi:redox-sensitive bicupin YhaK (pirin superfamily)